MKWLLVLAMLFSLSFGQSMAANDAFHERQVSDLKDDVAQLQRIVENMLLRESKMLDSDIRTFEFIKHLNYEIDVLRHLVVCLTTVFQRAPNSSVDEVVELCDGVAKAKVPPVEPFEDKKGE